MNENPTRSERLIGKKEVRYYQLTFTGRADHAGTTPMDQRLDAGQGASQFIVAANKCVVDNFPDCSINISSIQVKPGAISVIPGEATIMLSIYAPRNEVLVLMEKTILNVAKRGAAQQGLTLDIVNR